MTHEVEKKDIPVGVRTGNQCCICCQSCYSGPTIADPSVQGARCNNIYEPNEIERHCCTKTHEEPSPDDPVYKSWGTCIHSCCSCPPLSSVCMTVNVTDVGGNPVAYCPINGMEITLNPTDGVTICSGDNPIERGGVSCYPASSHGTLKTGIQDFNNTYEKWGFIGTLCDGEVTPEGCFTLGEDLRISLCCCDHCNNNIYVPEANAAECNTCNYQLMWNWKDWTEFPRTDPADPPGCSCPDDEYDCRTIPPCILQPDGGCFSHPRHDFTFITGRCPTGMPSDDHDFYLKFELGGAGLEDIWWNCDCCQNGCELYDQVTITCEITREACV